MNFDFEQQVPVLLEFKAMTTPVPITVPGYILHYLDTHSERIVVDDGSVIYRNPYLSALDTTQHERINRAVALMAY